MASSSQRRPVRPATASPRAADHLTVSQPDADDTACPAHPEYEKHCLSGRGCDRGGAQPSRDGGIEQGMAYFDGDTRVPMKTGDRIVIKK